MLSRLYKEWVQHMQANQPLFPPSQLDNSVQDLFAPFPSSSNGNINPPMPPNPPINVSMTASMGSLNASINNGLNPAMNASTGVEERSDLSPFPMAPYNSPPYSTPSPQPYNTPSPQPYNSSPPPVYTAAATLPTFQPPLQLQAHPFQPPPVSALPPFSQADPKPIPPQVVVPAPPANVFAVPEPRTYTPKSEQIYNAFLSSGEQPDTPTRTLQSLSLDQKNSNPSLRAFLAAFPSEGRTSNPSLRTLLTAEEQACLLPLLPPLANQPLEQRTSNPALLTTPTSAPMPMFSQTIEQRTSNTSLRTMMATDSNLDPKSAPLSLLSVQPEQRISNFLPPLLSAVPSENKTSNPSLRTLLTAEENSYLLQSLENIPMEQRTSNNSLSALMSTQNSSSDLLAMQTGEQRTSYHSLSELLNPVSPVKTEREDPGVPSPNASPLPIVHASKVVAHSVESNTVGANLVHAREVVATDIRQLSDARLKEDIRGLEGNSLDVIKRLTGRTFLWKRDAHEIAMRPRDDIPKLNVPQPANSSFSDNDIPEIIVSPHEPDKVDEPRSNLPTRSYQSPFSDDSVFSDSEEYYYSDDDDTIYSAEDEESEGEVGDVPTKTVRSSQ